MGTFWLTSSLYLIYSSQIDTTSVQALIDARNELERYTDRPVEFHFASILSPWIRRALVAGGFGTGLPASHGPREVAPVIPYRDRDLYSTSAPDSDLTSPNTVSDLESAADVRARGPRKTKHGFEEEGGARLVPVETPFFHFDLHTAVRAAEMGMEKTRAASLNGESPSGSRSSSRARESEDVKEVEATVV